MSVGRKGSAVWATSSCNASRLRCAHCPTPSYLVRVRVRVRVRVGVRVTVRVRVRVRVRVGVRVGVGATPSYGAVHASTAVLLDMYTFSA